MRSYLIKLENSDMNKFKVSMEDDAGMLNPEIVAAIVDIPKTQVDVAVAASDIAMQSSDVSSCMSVIETGQTDIATLSDIQDVLVEASTKVEGIDETTAAVTQIAVEAIYARLGLVAKPIPAMETFASIHSRKVATNVAIEGIGDSIKRIAQAIVKAIKLLIEKIRTFAQTFFENRGNLEKMVKIMKSRAKALGNDNPTTILSTTVSKAISLNYLDQKNTTHGCVHLLLTSTYGAVEYAENLSAVLHRKATEGILELYDTDKNPNAVLNTIITNEFKFTNVEAIIRGDKSRPVLPLTHQRSVFIEQNSDGINFLTVKGIEGTVNVKEMNGLNKNEILTVLDDVDRMLAKMSKFDKIKKQQEDALDTLLRRASTLEKMSSGDGETIKTVQKQLRYLIALSGFISVTIPEEYFKTIKTVLKVVDESIVLNS